MNDREQTVYDLARLGVSRHYVDRILRDLPSVQRGNEADCMAWPDALRAGFASRGECAFARISECFAGTQLPVTVLHQRDPRGAAVCVYRLGVDVESGEPMIRLGAPGFTTSELRRLDKAAEYRAAKVR